MWLRQATCGAPQSTEISGVESAEDQGLLCQQKTGCLSASTIRKQQPHQVGGQLEDSIVTEGVKDPHVSRVGTKEWTSWLATQLRIMFLPFDHAAPNWLAAFVWQTVSSSWHMVALLFTRFVGPGWWMLVDGGELLWSSLLRVPKASSHCLRLQLNFSACTQLPMKCVRAGSCCSPVGAVATSATWSFSDPRLND